MRKFAIASITFSWFVLYACADESTPAGITPALDASRPDVGQSTTDAPVVDPPDSSVPDVPEAPACPIAADETFDATLKISVDDKFKLHVNGTLVKEFDGTWGNVQTETIKLKKSPLQKNVIAVEGINAMNAGGLDRMIVVDITWTVGDAGATEHHVVTDSTWKRGAVPDGGTWTAIDFAETGWEPSTEEGTNGGTPYGAILGTSTAKYIWSYDSATVDVGSKPANETVYFRKSFWVDKDGAPQTTPQACP
jgi:hypothetical protein